MNKKLFALILTLIVTLSTGIALAGTLQIASKNVSGYPSNIYRKRSCEISSEHTRDHNPDCQGSSYHNVSQSWSPGLTISLTVECTVTGYGWAAGIFTQARVDGKTIADAANPYLKAQSDSEDQFGHWGFNGPIPVAIPNEQLAYPTTVSFSIYGVSKQAPEGTHYWDAHAGAQYKSVIWVGTQSTAIQTGASIGWSPSDPLPSLTVHANNTETSGKSATPGTILGSSISEFDGQWEVSYKEYCESHENTDGRIDSRLEIDGEHSHHWECPAGSGSMNGGCGNHIQCRDNIPERHKLQDKCPGPATDPSGHCSVGAPYRPCTHDCEYYSPEDWGQPDPICKRRESGNFCNMESSDVKTTESTYHTDHQVLSCGGEGDSDQNTDGCGESWFKCSLPDKSEHGARTCSKKKWVWKSRGLYPDIKVEVTCGAKFRFCTNNGIDNHSPNERQHLGMLDD